MSEPSAPDDAGLPLPQMRHVDQICDRFEAALKAGQQPQIEKFLREATEPGRSILLRELLGLELDYRRGRDERPKVEQYRLRFPNDVELIDAVIREGVSSSKPLSKQPDNRETVKGVREQETVQELLDAQGDVFAYWVDKVLLGVLDAVPDEAQPGEHPVIFADVCCELGVDGFATLQVEVLALEPLPDGMGAVCKGQKQRCG